MRAIVGLILFTLVGSVSGAAQFSHRDLDAALRDHVRAGHVNYPGLANDSRFLAYLKGIEQADAAKLGGSAERLTFWINAYNALAIKGILDGGSPSSFLGRIGYFSGAVYDVGGRSINLYDLERKVIIPMGEPRIHFAINCASMSCPILRSGSYKVAQLDKQLDAATRAFLNDSSRNRFDRQAKVAHLSKIFDWFEDDFGGSDEAVLAYVSRYVSDPALAASLTGSGWKIEYLEYDWSLNGDPPPA